MDVATLPFWSAKTLEEMTRSEWESLCDGCGRCCLVKLEDEESGEVHLTKLACRMLDQSTCRCSDYPNRQTKMPDCVAIDPEKVRRLVWLPESCAYRRLAEGPISPGGIRLFPATRIPFTRLASRCVAGCAVKPASAPPAITATSSPTSAEWPDEGLGSRDWVLGALE